MESSNNNNQTDRSAFESVSDDEVSITSSDVFSDSSYEIDTNFYHPPRVVRRSNFVSIAPLIAREELQNNEWLSFNSRYPWEMFLCAARRAAQDHRLQTRFSLGLLTIILRRLFHALWDRVGKTRHSCYGSDYAESTYGCMACVHFNSCLEYAGLSRRMQPFFEERYVPLPRDLFFMRGHFAGNRLLRERMEQPNIVRYLISQLESFELAADIDSGRPATIVYVDAYRYGTGVSVWSRVGGPNEEYVLQNFDVEDLLIGNWRRRRNQLESRIVLPVRRQAVRGRGGRRGAPTTVRGQFQAEWIRTIHEQQQQQRF